MSRINYTPKPPPTEPEGLVRYLYNELTRLSEIIGVVSQRSTGQLWLSNPPAAAKSVAASTIVEINEYDTIFLEDDVVASLATGSFTLTRDGRVSINFEASVSVDKNSTSLEFYLIVDGVPDLSTKLPVFAKTAGESVFVTFADLSDYNRGERISIGVAHDDGMTRLVTFDAVAFFFDSQGAV